MSVTKATGSTYDISLLCRFCFWQPVYYQVYDSDLPSHISENHGQWVGIAGHV